ncbi:MAG: hypothetical protein WCI68_06415, partial [Actinomycetes bacterium]
MHKSSGTNFRFLSTAFLSMILALSGIAITPATGACSYPAPGASPEVFTAWAECESAAYMAEMAAAAQAAQAQAQAAAQAEAQAAAAQAATTKEAAAKESAAKEAASHNPKDVAQIASLSDEVKKLNEELSGLKSKLAEQTAIAEKTKIQAAEIEKLQQSSKSNDEKFTEANTRLTEASKKITELLSKVTSTEAEKQELITAKSKEATVANIAKIADV